VTGASSLLSVEFTLDSCIGLVIDRLGSFAYASTSANIFRIELAAPTSATAMNNGPGLFGSTGQLVGLAIDATDALFVWNSCQR
jgi:hypothetical protein